MIMKDLGTTLLVATPSYAMYISEVMEEKGYKPEDFKLRVRNARRGKGTQSRCAAKLRSGSALK